VTTAATPAAGRLPHVGVIGFQVGMIRDDSELGWFVEWRGMASSYTLDATWLTTLKDLGVIPADVLRRAGLPDDLLQQDSPRLTPAVFYRFWDSVEAAVGDPLFPLRLCQSVTSESFTPLMFAALSSPNLCVAAERAGRYKALVSPMCVEVTHDDEVVVTELSWPHPPPQPPASLVLKELLVAVTLARAATREPICPTDVATTELPAPLEPYEEFFGTPLRQGPRHELTFTLADATRPFLTADEGMWKAFEPALSQRLSELEAPVTTTRRVRAALFEALPTGRTTLEEIGRRLAVSTRTLQRQMEAEGTSFQRILSETRETLARHYLTSTTLTPAEIALLLGYDEPNSFSRAFKSWTGTTPATVRRGRQMANATTGGEG
jgi:AraC-like DNA-binding protein